MYNNSSSETMIQVDAQAGAGMSQETTEFLIW